MAKRESLSKADLNARQTAIDAGLSAYTRENGELYVIRNRTNQRWRQNYGGQGGRDEVHSARRGNRGGGRDGSRVRHENASTPPGTDKKAFNKAMSDARKAGLEGDHNYDVSRTGQGLRGKPARRRNRYHRRYKNAGVKIGNQAGNVTPRTTKVNQSVKPAETRALDNALKPKKDGLKPPRQGRGSKGMKGPSFPRTRLGGGTMEMPSTFLPPASTYDPKTIEAFGFPVHLP